MVSRGDALNRRQVVGALALGMLGSSASLPALAQAAYPTKAITLVVPFPPGGSTDTIGRLVAEALSRSLGQPVVVENRPGANGNIGSQAVARAPADGYTLLLSGVGSNAINHGLYARMPYDSRRDFTHITLLATGPNVLVANTDFAAKSLKEFVDLARASPDKYNYASSGNGSSGHLAMELLKQTADIKVAHVPYKGGSPALTDVIGGQVPVMFINQDVVLPHVKAGKLRVLGVAGAERNPAYPDVPTIAEQGYPGFSAVSWFGLSAPANLPKEILARLHAETVKALQTPALADRLTSNGFVVGANAPDAFAAFVGSEMDKWSKVAKAAGATVD